MTKFIEEKEDFLGDAPPPMARVLREAIRAELVELRVALPAEVLEYDLAKQSVNVQPHFKRKYGDGTIRDMPKLFNVPVAFPRTANASIVLPIKKGDNVLLVFTDRSLDKWKQHGGTIDPEDGRIHNLSDAVAYPGLFPFSKPVEIANGDDIIIKNVSGGSHCEVRIKNNNHLQVLNATEEFVKVLDDMLTVIREAVVYTSTGPQQLRHALFAQVQSRLQTFLEG